MRMSQQAAQIHVLVVDDDQDCREMFSTYLTYVGCNVRTAEDGRDAIDAATHWAPDVIVMDLSMPNVDGWTASKRLKASPATRGIPIIALSAIQMGREGARACIRGHGRQRHGGFDHALLGSGRGRRGRPAAGRSLL